MKNIFLSLAAVAALFTACSQDNDNEIPVPVTENTGILEFGASIPETRTYLNGNKVFWSQGDVLSVWSNDIQSPRPYVLSDGANTNEATFIYTPTKDVPTGVSGTDFYAVYPQEFVSNVSRNVAYITLPQGQTCNTENTKNFLPNFNPMAAMTTEDLNGMQFQNLCGIVVIDIIPDQDLNLTRIVLETEDSKALCGEATITFGEKISMVMKSPTDNTRKVTLSCGNMPLTKGETYSYYVIVPPGEYNDFGVQVYTNKKRNEPSLYKVRTNRPTPLKLEAGMITTIGVNFKLATVEPVPPHAYKVGDVYPFEGTPEGIVYTLINPTTQSDGTQVSTTGKMISLTKISGTYAFYKGAANEDGEFVNVSGLGGNRTNGMLNLTRAISVNNDLKDFPAFQKVRTTLGDNWYIPAIDEFTTIIDNRSELEIAWKNARNDQTTPMLDNGRYCSSTVDLLDGGWVNIYYYEKLTSRAKWTQKEAMVNNADPDESTPNIVYIPAYSVIAISAFESK